MTIDHLYKYGRLNEHSEDLFSTARIWCSPPSQLNDPFECRPYVTFEGSKQQILERILRMDQLPEEDAEAKAEEIFQNGQWRDPDVVNKARKDLLKALETKIGIYCLSRVQDSILMWSHYASDHKGYCLEFEATNHTEVFGEARPIRYSDAYPIISCFDTPKEKQSELALLTKYKGWAYEQEWRIIDHENGPGFREYPPELLKSVVFGLRMPEGDKAKIREWIGRRGHTVQFYQAERNEDRFSIEIIPANRPPTCPTKPRSTRSPRRSSICDLSRNKGSPVVGDDAQRFDFRRLGFL